jgi:multidrug resistance efflux pump
MSLIFKALRLLVTVALVGLAGLMAVGLWRQYMVAPWTRDGRVRAEVVDVAPEVAGTVVAVVVVDNQLVHKGDLLFQIDPSRYRLAVEQAEAELEQRRQDLRLKQADTQRRAGLAGVVSAEDIDRHKGTSDVAAAAMRAAEVALDIARLNLERTALRAPANGYVTNLRLRVGDFVGAGTTRVAVLDADSFWIAGYFEETKLARIHVGDRAKIALMGFPLPLDGHVDSIGRGIADANDHADARGLPDVNPVFTWVRLAQRIPVKLRIDHVPDNTLLAAGMTCSIAVGPEAETGSGYLTRLRALAEETLRSWRT